MIRSFVYNTLNWISDAVSRRLQNVLLAILAAGPMPKHIAFIMDGNRRYARSRYQAVVQGHTQGFATLRRVSPLFGIHAEDTDRDQVLEICMRLNIRCVSVYAFAIDNFRRPPEEVEALMTLAKEKLVEISQHGQV